MPFIAKHRQTGDRLDITMTENPRQYFQPGECICPYCNADFIIKAGLINAPHFAHKTVCTSDWKSNPESAEHRAGKLFLLQNLTAQIPEYKGAAIELEVPVPEIRRIADLMVTLPTGWKIAHEVQLAKITVEDLEARTNDYNSAGLDVVWWLGKSAATTANEHWCQQVFGFCLSLNFQT